MRLTACMAYTQMLILVHSIHAEMRPTACMSCHKKGCLSSGLGGLGFGVWVGPLAFGLWTFNV